MRECPRCGGPIKSDAPLCQPCATVMANRKRWAQKWPSGKGRMFSHTKPRIKSHVTLPKLGA